MNTGPHANQPVPAARPPLPGVHPDDYGDELTDLLALLLERAWRRRHADEALLNVDARNGPKAPR